MKIRTIIAATCAALAFSMAGPVSPMMAKRKPSRRTSRRPFPISRQVADRRGGRLRAGRGLPVPHPREVGFHLRLCDLGRDRVEGE